jgi:pyridoxine/pyridoxamine 5'-phosphate oxidase
MSVSVEAKKLLDQTNLMTISTIAPDGGPQAAVVEFACTSQLEIVFDTKRDSRKFASLERDSRVALVIGWDDNRTIQYEGMAEVLSGAELARCKQIYFAKNPAAKKWEAEPSIVYIKVTPKWLRYTDLNHHPWDIQETVF